MLMLMFVLIVCSVFRIMFFDACSPCVEMSGVVVEASYVIVGIILCRVEVGSGLCEILGRACAVRIGVHVGIYTSDSRNGVFCTSTIMNVYVVLLIRVVKYGLVACIISKSMEI